MWRKVKASPLKPQLSVKKCSSSFMESAICDFEHERSLRRECGISESSWKPQETSTQCNTTSSQSNYVEENAALLSGRIPGFKDDHIKLLFSTLKYQCSASLKKPATKAISSRSSSLNLPNCGNSFTQMSL